MYKVCLFPQTALLVSDSSHTYTQASVLVREEPFWPHYDFMGSHNIAYCQVPPQILQNQSLKLLFSLQDCPAKAPQGAVNLNKQILTIS